MVGEDLKSLINSKVLPFNQVAYNSMVKTDTQYYSHIRIIERLMCIAIRKQIKENQSRFINNNNNNNNNNNI